MTASPLFPGFDGLMTLSRREGVDIRPTLLRVLTDLYVQASAHSADEAMSPRLKRGENPERTSSGKAMRPIAATVAGAEPAAAPNTMTAATVEWPTPPR